MIRRALFVASLAAAACGLGLEGTRVDVDAGETADAAVDATVDATVDTTVDATVDAGGPCSDPSLVLCMRFEDALTDEAHGQIATTTGTIAYGAGKSGQAVVLDPTSSIHFADSNAWSYSKLTFETWLRADAIPDGGRAGLLDKDNSFGVFLYSNGQISCTMAGGASANVVIAGQWVHIACVNDGQTVRLYADGVEKASNDAGLLAMTDAAAAVGGNSPSGDPLTGALDTLRVYARAKTPAEIAAAAAP